MADGDDWIEVEAAAARLGLPYAAVLLLVQTGVIPSIRAVSANRSPYKIPVRLVEDARQAVLNGGQVVLAEFAPLWVARQRANGQHAPNLVGVA
jgi:hypothetical protein